MPLLVRGWLATAFASISLVVGDIVQRVIIAPWVKLMPSKRIPVLSGWMKIMAWLVTRPVAVLGGFVIPKPPRVVPARPGVLVVMNHQSLFDIPLVIQSVAGGYPRIVTRKRYARRIPLVSYMARLYQYPVVDPTANGREMRRLLDELEVTARESDVPIVIFPEGTRTRDGGIGRFKKGALERILAARPWTVYVLVADGFWKAAKYRDFVRGPDRIQGKIRHVATLEWPDPEADATAFMREMRQLMIEGLDAMRAGAAVA